MINLNIFTRKKKKQYESILYKPAGSWVKGNNYFLIHNLYGFYFREALVWSTQVSIQTHKQSGKPQTFLHIGVQRQNWRLLFTV